MFEIFEQQINDILPIIRNADFINENYDLIMRSVDRMEIVLNDFYFQSFLEIEDSLNWDYITVYEMEFGFLWRI